MHGVGRHTQVSQIARGCIVQALPHKHRRLVDDSLALSLPVRDVDTCIVPRTRTRFGDRSFSAAGPQIWNSLPPDLQRPDIELGEFRRLLKTFLFV